MKAITVTTPTEIIPGTDIAGLVSDWLAHLEMLERSGELSNNTRIAYARGWDKFSSWLYSQDVDQVSGDVIRRWIAELKSEGRASNTVNLWLAGVRAFFAWAVGNRRLAVNPTEGVKGSKRKGIGKHHLREALTNAEVRRVLSLPDTTTTQGKRDLAMLMLKAYTAARDVELYRADYSDLRTENDRLVLYVQGKGRESSDEFIVLAHPVVEDAIYDWLAARGNEPGPLFISLSNRGRGRLSLRSIRGMVKDYYKLAGVHGERKTSHSLRHSAITNAIRHGAPPQKVQSMARHGSMDTTLGYYHEVDRIDNPAEAFIDYSNGNGEAH